MTQYVVPTGSQQRVTARDPLVQEHYDTWRVQTVQRHANFCAFCDDMTAHRIVGALETVVVIENRFPYLTFDGQVVKQHLLLVPLRHVDRFSQFTEQEDSDYHKLLAVYHNDGFSSMTRSVVDTHRSVPGHLHTHLLTYN